MAIGLTFRPASEANRRLAAAFTRLRNTATDVRVALGRIGMFVRRNAQRLLRQRQRTWGPMTLRLSRSLAIVVERNAVRVGSNLVYAAIQQLGGEVRPKTAKFLAIPVSPQLRRRGVWPRDLPRDSMKWVPNADIRIGSHSWKGPALVRATDETRPGTPRKNGSQGKDRIVKRAGEVMFALVRRASIQGRPYLVFDAPAQVFALAEFSKLFRRRWGGR